MQTTIIGSIGVMVMSVCTPTWSGCTLGLYRDNGKENGNYYSMIRLYIGVI